MPKNSKYPTIQIAAVIHRRHGLGACPFGTPSVRQRRPEVRSDPRWGTGGSGAVGGEFGRTCASMLILMMPHGSVGAGDELARLDSGPVVATSHCPVPSDLKSRAPIVPTGGPFPGCEKRPASCLQESVAARRFAGIPAVEESPAVQAAYAAARRPFTRCKHASLD